MKGSFGKTVVLVLAVLGSACAGSGLGMTRAGLRTREPRLPAVAVNRFTVVAQPVGRAQVPTAGQNLSWLLAESATSEAEKSLLSRRVASSVQRPAAGGGDKQPRLSGEVVMPVSLPPHLKGLAAAGLDGSLATASVRLVDEEGRTLGEGTASVDWDDVRWLRGAKYKRSRPVSEALADAARRAVDLAVRQLERSLGG